MAAAIERMGLEIGRGMRTLTMNQQRMDKTFALHKKKELGKKDLDDDLAKLKARDGHTGQTSKTFRRSGGTQ